MKTRKVVQMKNLLTPQMKQIQFNAIINITVKVKASFYNIAMSKGMGMFSRPFDKFRMSKAAYITNRNSIFLHRASS